MFTPHLCSQTWKKDKEGYLYTRAKVTLFSLASNRLVLTLDWCWHDGTSAASEFNMLCALLWRLLCIYIHTYRVGNGVNGLWDATVLLLLRRGTISALVIGVCTEKQFIQSHYVLEQRVDKQSISDITRTCIYLMIVFHSVYTCIYIYIYIYIYSSMSQKMEIPFQFFNLFITISETIIREIVS